MRPRISLRLCSKISPGPERRERRGGGVGGREGGREGGSDGGREGWREGWREGERGGGRKIKMEVE